MSTRTWASRFLTTRRSSSGTARRSPGGGSSPATSSSSTIFITPGSTSVTGASSTPGGAAAASWSRGSTSRGTGPAGSEVADSDTRRARALDVQVGGLDALDARAERSEEHTSELQSQSNLVCRLLLEKKKKRKHSTLVNQSLFSDLWRSDLML